MPIYCQPNDVEYRLSLNSPVCDKHNVRHVRRSLLFIPQPFLVRYCLFIPNLYLLGKRQKFITKGYESVAKQWMILLKSIYQFEVKTNGIGEKLIILPKSWIFKRNLLCFFSFYTKLTKRSRSSYFVCNDRSLFK